MQRSPMKVTQRAGKDHAGGSDASVSLKATANVTNVKEANSAMKSFDLPHVRQKSTQPTAK